MSKRAESEQRHRPDPLVRQRVGEQVGCTDSEEQGR
jgi:hypothetical protein